MTKLTTLGLVLLCASLLWADCDPSVLRNTPDTRTGIETLNYLLCHSELPYNTMAGKLIEALGAGQACVTLSAAVAADDGVPIYTTQLATKVTAVACRCTGTCTAPVATVSVKHQNGTAIVLSGTLTCATTGLATWQTTSSSNTFSAGEGMIFDVTNTPGSADYLTVCVALADTLP